MGKSSSSNSVGSSMPLLSKKICDTITMDFDTLVQNRSGLTVVLYNKRRPRHSCKARITGL